MLKDLLVKTAILAFALSMSFTAHAMADSPKRFSVPAGELVQALESFAKQTDVELVYQEAQLKGLRTRGVNGTYTAHDAVIMLLEGTKLRLATDTATGAMLIALPGKAAPDSTTANASNVDPSSSPSSNGKDGRGHPSGTFLLAQATPEQTQAEPSVANEADQKAKKTPPPIEEIVVTGSRIPVTKEAAQEVQVYSRERIEQSGQTSVTDFLNGLPQVSVSSSEASLQTPNNTTTVQLHGLPVGTTLVLINGRRPEVSGVTSFPGNGSFFDLNNIPLMAVERIEVLPVGSSAIYGSDAIAGVVNIILKKNFDGLEAIAKYGSASGINEWDGSLAIGHKWSQASFSIIGTFQTRGQLLGSERTLTANNDYRAYGGPDNRNQTCLPGNVYSPDGVTPLPGLGNATYAAVPVGFRGTPSINEFAGTAGTLNSCSSTAGGGTADYSFIPETHRAGFFAEGNYSITAHTEIFAEMMFSHVEQLSQLGPPGLFGQPGFQSFTVSPANPFNPFQTTVGVSTELTGLDHTNPTNTTFFRPLLGIRGSFLNNWTWEASAWDSEDRSNNVAPFLNNAAVQNALNSANPATALNPFIDGPAGSTQLLQSLVYDVQDHASSQTLAADAFVRGPLFELPAGAVQLVFGGEYNRNKIYTSQYYPPSSGFSQLNTNSTHDRSVYSLFAEARIPILANSSNPTAGDRIALTAAGRYDKYSDFGDVTTPQFGVEFRPWDSLLFRGTYGKSYRAPTLASLYYPQVLEQNIPVTDPLHGNQRVPVNVLFGGNPDLQAERGNSWTYGFSYTSAAIPLLLSVTGWQIKENNNVQGLFYQTIIDNEATFPDRVIRGPPVNGQPGTITEVNATQLNFGRIDAAGVDLQASYAIATDLGQFTPSISATDTYRYTTVLVPGAPLVDQTSIANDDGNWAVRWKGTAALDWKLSSYSVHFARRYVGRYQDYDSTAEIGNFWLFDLTGHVAVGEAFASGSALWRGSYLDFGAVNLFNKAPQFSNYQFALDGGYDPAQADLRQRFLFVQVGARW